MRPARRFNGGTKGSGPSASRSDSMTMAGHLRRSHGRGGGGSFCRFATCASGLELGPRQSKPGRTDDRMADVRTFPNAITVAGIPMVVPGEHRTTVRASQPALRLRARPGFRRLSTRDTAMRGQHEQALG